jgi:hypothetical protein
MTGILKCHPQNEQNRKRQARVTEVVRAVLFVPSLFMGQWVKANCVYKTFGDLFLLSNKTNGQRASLFYFPVHVQYAVVIDPLSSNFLFAFQNGTK